MELKVILLAHTQLADKYWKSLDWDFGATDGQIVSLTAIRTCYSPNNPTEIVAKEGEKYFGKKATDGGTGSDADRLIRHIMKSKHVSTMEHLNFSFAIEGVSRSLLAQLTRHRHMSFSVQSQRYCRFGSGDKSGGFDYVIPETIKKSEKHTEGLNGVPIYADTIFEEAMERAQQCYDLLRKCGVPAEDARAVLPNAAATNLVMTANLRSLLEFYEKRKPGNGAQKEITQLAEELKNRVVEVEPWTSEFFEG
jgi:thymidylate synthase (FAD)